MGRGGRREGLLGYSRHLLSVAGCLGDDGAVSTDGGMISDRWGRKVDWMWANEVEGEVCCDGGWEKESDDGWDRERMWWDTARTYCLDLWLPSVSMATAKFAELTRWANEAEANVCCGGGRDGEAVGG